VDGVSAASRAAARILAHEQSLAREITAALYRDMPELMEKHGDRGRAKCLQDMHYNLEHLAPAVEMEAPEMFATYARWLDGLLRARNVSAVEVVRCLELTERQISETFPPDEADAVAPCIRAGLGALAAGAS
jgi:hypothetical protein